MTAVPPGGASPDPGGDPAPDDPGDPFVTTLSVSEFVLLGQVGFRPLGLAFGCSVYEPGDAGPRDDGEQESVTQELYFARQRAMARLHDEAERLGADGVVGLDLSVGPTTSGRLAHVTALGTAVRADAPPPTGTWRTPGGTPFTCTLSGQDLWTLLRAGHAPLGVVLGASVYLATAGSRNRSVGDPGPERDGAPDPEAAERAGHTQAVHAARVRAFDRLRADAADLRADGVVDVRVSGLTDPLRPGPVEVVAVGTAVRALGGSPPAPIVPAYVLPMTGR